MTLQPCPTYKWQPVGTANHPSHLYNFGLHCTCPELTSCLAAVHFDRALERRWNIQQGVKYLFAWDGKKRITHLNMPAFDICCLPPLGTVLHRHKGVCLGFGHLLLCSHQPGTLHLGLIVFLEVNLDEIIVVQSRIQFGPHDSQFHGVSLRMRFICCRRRSGLPLMSS